MASMEREEINHPRYGPCVRLRRGNDSVLASLRGGQVLSWSHGGHEQLFLSERSRHDPGASIRGGIPVIFPQFAGHGPGPRHGFARTALWSIAGRATTPPGGTSLCLRLRDSPATRAVWPHRFVLEHTIALEQSGLALMLELRNTDDRPWIFSAALHSYWRITPGHPVSLEPLATFSFQDRSEAGCHSPAAGPLRTSHEIERLYRDVPRQVRLKEARSLVLTSEGWPDLMVWNPGPGKGRALTDLDPGAPERFLCVEPLQFEALSLAPGERWRTSHHAAPEAG